MYEEFVSHNFRKDALDLIETCDQTIKSYMGQGLMLTLRQLYYTLVAAGRIPNEEKSYKRLGAIISDARLAGMLDWSGIEDRVRRPYMPTHWDSIDDIIQSACEQFKLDRREGQETYVELWVEKDALAGVLSPLAQQFHCTLSVNRGYSSQSAMYDAAKRFKEAVFEREQHAVIIYIGDFDPSGEDMVRDVRERLEMFGVSVDVDKVALTMEQIKKHKPPPNPAKLSDSRAAGYIAKHGQHSWEVDALPPKELQRIAREALAYHTDMEAMSRVKKEETKQVKATAKKLGLTLHRLKNKEDEE